jgi:hypothetical protein
MSKFQARVIAEPTSAINIPGASTARWLAALCYLFVLSSPMLYGASAGEARYREVVIHNAIPRRDTSGHIIDAHDGCLQFFDHRYYLYGTAYGKSAGYSIHNRFRVYSSADLVHWRFEGELLKSPPDGVYYRPYVAFNPKTRKYVLWFNWYPKLWEGQVGVAVSDTPVGPFTIVNPKVELSQAVDRPGDGSLFVDNDGTGYFVYTTIGQDHAIRMERLTADYLGSTKEVSDILGKGCEAPTVFRRGSLYYALFDSTCCFCSSGSGARVLTASAPLGPYTERPNINRDANQKPIVAAQQTFVAQIPTSQGIAFIWMGDRWGSRPDGIKGHDFQYWSSPLEFGADGEILPIRNVKQWSVSIEVGKDIVSNPTPYQWPQKKDLHPLTIDPCTGAALREEE